MSVKLLGDIFNANWASWQDIAIIALIVVVAALVIFLIAFLLLNNARMEEDGKRIAKRVAWYEKQIEAKRKSLEAEKAQSEEELGQIRKELQEKEEAVNTAESEALLARQRYFIKEQEIKKLLETVEMSKKELAEYQKREGTNVAEDVAVNALTDKTLMSSELEMDGAITDCKIPLEKTFGYPFATVTEYIAKKPQTKSAPPEGNRPVVYKVEGKTFALVKDLGDGKFSIALKCGPAYGSKLINHKKGVVENAKFPYGLLWFSVTNEKTACSLELVKQLLDISYRVAKLGY